MKKNGKEKKIYSLLAAKTALFLLAAVVIFAGMPALPATSFLSIQKVYAQEENFIIEHVSGFGVIQGEEISLGIEVQNETGSNADIEISLSDGKGDFTVSKKSQSSTSVAKGGRVQAVFTVKAGRFADTGDRSLTVTVKNNTTGGQASKRISLNVSQNMSPNTGSMAAAFDITLTKGADGIQTEKVSQIGFELFNKGNTYLKNTIVTLTLPEGLSIQGGSSSANLGYVTIGDTKTVEFPVTAEKKTPSKNYPFTVKISGVDSAGNTQSVEQVFYIPVKGEAEKEEGDVSDVEIQNIKIPESVNQGKDFQMDFQLVNTSSREIGKARVTVEIPEGLINKTKNVFSVSSLKKGSPQNFSIKLFAPEADADKYYSLKITVEEENSGKENVSAVTQYAGVYAKKTGSSGSSEKTPQLIVSDYSYGGTYVYAGGKFRLGVTVLNTSANHVIKNVKVTITSDDGTFIPVGSSNSYYIDKIGKKDKAATALMMSVKPDAEQKTSSLSVAMAYEDENGNAFTATDIIAIPVQQESRLVVDDVTQPPELYVGMESSVNVQFYNMGKTVLNNLRVSANGNFDISGSKMYYVGNMAAGSSDYYDLMLVPTESGPLSGSVVFTYEDAAGGEIVYEQPFEFSVMEGSPWEEDPGMTDPAMEEPSSRVPWKVVIPVLILAAAALGFVIWKKRKKKKLHAQMTLED